MTSLGCVGSDWPQSAAGSRIFINVFTPVTGDAVYSRHLIALLLCWWAIDVMDCLREFAAGHRFRYRATESNPAEDNCTIEIRFGLIDIDCLFVSPAVHEGGKFAHWELVLVDL